LELSWQFIKKITKIIDSLESQSLDWLNDSEFYFTQSNMPAPDQCLEDTLKFIAVHKINDGDWLDTNFIHNPAKWDFTKIPFTPYDQNFMNQWLIIIRIKIYLN